MLSEVLGGIKLALRRWRATLSVAVIFALVCVVLAVILADVLTQTSTLRSGAALRRAHAVIFTPFYPVDGVSKSGQKVLTELAHRIDAGEGYSAVIRNLNVNNPDTLGGIPTILVIGAAVDGIFPELGLCSPAPCVSRGREVDSQAPEVQLGDLTLTATQPLPQGAVWVDPNAAGMNLDRAQIIRITPKEIRHLDGYAKEELVARAVFLNPSDGTLTNYVSAAADGRLYLVPEYLETQQPARFRGLMVRAGMYLVALIAFTGLIAFAYSATVREILQREIWAFKIRRMCGATDAVLAVRVVVFLAMVTVVAPVAMCVALIMGGPPVAVGAVAALVCVATVFCAVVSVALRAIQKEVSSSP